MHKLLQRQLKRLRISALDQPPNQAQWEKFLTSIDRAYTQADQDRYLIERSLAISSEEMQQLYDDLRKSAELQLAEVNTKLNSILGSLNHGVIVLDDDGEISIFNKAAEQMFGRSLHVASAPTGDRLFDMPLIDLDGNLIPFPAEGNFEGLMARPEGGFTPIDMSTSSLLIEGKRHYISIIRDISGRRATERALVDAKNEAQAANQAKSAFLANMSHEIRTPLNAVIGLAGLMLDTELNLEQRDFMETIRNSGDSLLSILNDILDFSKIEAGQMELENQPFSIPQLIDDVVDLLGAKAASKGLELIFDLEPELPELICGDVTRLRQIFINLVGNAVKFTQEGHITIGVHLKRDPFQSEPKRRVLFSVTDTGIGIPEDRLDRIFKSFSQVDASTTRKFGGTGLGLTISKQLVELMEGEIDVESEVGEGTRFTFEIAAEMSDNPKPLFEPIHKLENKTIALIHPYKPIATYLERYLQHWGSRVVYFDTLDAFFDAYTSGAPIDGIVIDDRALSNDSQPLPHLPTIQLVGYGFRQEQARLTEPLTIRNPVKWAMLKRQLSALFETKADTAINGSKKPKRTKIIEDIAAQYPLRILLVDDNAINQKVGINILKRMGYRADKASGGHEALEALVRQTYDLVFLDIQMPDLDGVEVMRMIRQDWRSDDQPYLIALTANALEGDREKYLSFGFDAYLSKPVRFDEVKEAIRICASHLMTAKTQTHA